MSSFRNAIKRVTHKERSQPVARQHLGLLEKKKDYQLRAKDYHRKQDILTNMRRKADMKNPDEFYFGMNNSQIIGGKHAKLEQVRFKEQKDVVGSDAVKIMKSQDLNYIRLQRMRDEKKIDQLQASLHFIGEEQQNTLETSKHTVFLDSKEEAQHFDIVQYFDTDPEYAHRKRNRPRKDTKEKNIDEYGEATNTVVLHNERDKIQQARRDKKRDLKMTKARSSSYKEVEVRKARLEKLKHVEAHLITERIVASKGRKRKIVEAQNGQPALYKFRRKRAS